MQNNPPGHSLRSQPQKQQTQRKDKRKPVSALFLVNEKVPASNERSITRNENCKRKRQKVTL